VVVNDSAITTLYTCTVRYILYVEIAHVLSIRNIFDFCPRLQDMHGNVYELKHDIYCIL
jgi:hypothetical protein